MKNSSAYSLSFSLSNKGNREGTEVAQVYIRRMDDAEGPIKTLKAFKRIVLKAGEKQQVPYDELVIVMAILIFPNYSR